MRSKAFSAAIALVLLLGAVPTGSAEAGWFWRDRDPDAPDRYPYVYDPPRYYPFYNSNYWRPAWQMRQARPYYVQPPYYPAWGYPVGCTSDCEPEGPPLK